MYCYSYSFTLVIVIILLILCNLTESLQSCDIFDENDTENNSRYRQPEFEDHVEMVKEKLRRVHARNSLPLFGKIDSNLRMYTSSFLQLSTESKKPWVLSDAGHHLGQIADSYSNSNMKWTYGHCVCEVCHNIMEQLQVKMFSEYGYDFTDDDIHDVLEDSFCDNVLPYYRSPCQYILSYRYHSLASMITYMIPYDICQTQRLCMGARYN
eukprot:c7152_g1_i1.p1 GENE.c7152_g1_i1~~c7152_g1_i1.p1  ORF type:complete len:210 (-),score=72.23 c7152_g1_i1:39-668(-)